MKDYVAWQADRAAESTEVWVECKDCREGWFLELFANSSSEQDVTCDNCNKSWVEYVDADIDYRWRFREARLD